jgi:hypothetical protein
VDENDMEDEMARVKHGVESAIDMVFLSACGHDSTVLSVPYLTFEALPIWGRHDTVWWTKWPEWNMDLSLLLAWFSCQQPDATLIFRAYLTFKFLPFSHINEKLVK